MTLQRRLDALEESMFGEGYQRWGSDPAWGKSYEQIESLYSGLPAEIAQKAREYAARRQHGETGVDDEVRILTEGSAVQQMAVLVSYGERSAIPTELAEAGMELHRQALADPLPSHLGEPLKRFVLDAVSRARELFNAEG